MTPYFDYHALAPVIVLSAVTLIALVVEFVWKDSARHVVPQIAGIGLLLALIPVFTLAADGADRSMFNGAYVVDNYSLAFAGFFLIVGYISLLLSYDYIADGDYYQGEFYVLLLTSVLGLVIMASARDLITIFVALETISLPTFVLAGWRKHDTRSNEAAIKYFLIGVLSTAIMLYGMSLIFGMAHSTLLSDIATASGKTQPALFAVAIFMTLVGFAFKISAVPFHFWAPDTYDGAPMPVTAFLSVASKAGGFVALLTIVFFGFFPSPDSWQPVLWVLAAALDHPRQPRRVASDEHHPDARVLVDRAGRLHPRAARRVRRRQRGEVRLRGRGDLHLHLRGDEPRRVRLRDRQRAAHPLHRDQLVRRAWARRTRRSRWCSRSSCSRSPGSRRSRAGSPSS